MRAANPAREHRRSAAWRPGHVDGLLLLVHFIDVPGLPRKKNALPWQQHLVNGKGAQRFAARDHPKLLFRSKRCVEAVVIHEFLSHTSVQKRSGRVLGQQLFMTQMAQQVHKLLLREARKWGSRPAQEPVSFARRDTAALGNSRKQLLHQRRQMHALHPGRLEPLIDEQRNHGRRLHGIQAQLVPQGGAGA